MDLAVVKVCRSCSSNPMTVSRNHTIEDKPHVLMSLKRKSSIPFNIPLHPTCFQCTVKPFINHKT